MGRLTRPIQDATRLPEGEGGKTRVQGHRRHHVCQTVTVACVNGLKTVSLVSVTESRPAAGAGWCVPVCVLDGQSMHFLHLTDWEGAKILPGQDEDVESCVWFQVVRGQRPCCPNHGAPLHRTIWAHPGHLCGLIPTFPEVEEYLTEETDGNLTGADFSCWHLWRVRQPRDGLIAGHV